MCGLKCANILNKKNEICILTNEAIIVLCYINIIWSIKMSFKSVNIWKR
jgi:hypothetical protein